MRDDTLPTVAVNKWLHELHGQYSTRSDIALTHAVAWSVTALVMMTCIAEGLPVWMVVVLAVLTVDIAGGVVSNFTPGTNAYYRNSRRKRNVFIALHLIQPAVLLALFPLHAGWVAAATLPALVIAWRVNRSFGEPGIAAGPIAVAAMTVSGLLLAGSPAFALAPPPAALTTILVLYILKVGVAFPVDWHPDRNTGGTRAKDR